MRIPEEIEENEFHVDAEIFDVIEKASAVLSDATFDQLRSAQSYYDAMINDIYRKSAVMPLALAMGI